MTIGNETNQTSIEEKIESLRTILMELSDEQFINIVKEMQKARNSLNGTENKMTEQGKKLFYFAKPGDVITLIFNNDEIKNIVVIRRKANRGKGQFVQLQVKETGSPNKEYFEMTSKEHGAFIKTCKFVIRNEKKVK